MEKNKEAKESLIKDIHSLSKIIQELSLKYDNEPLMEELQTRFLGLSVNISIAADIPLQ